MPTRASSLPSVVLLLFAAACAGNSAGQLQAPDPVSRVFQADFDRALPVLQAVIGSLGLQITEEVRVEDGSHVMVAEVSKTRQAAGLVARVALAGGAAGLLIPAATSERAGPLVMSLTRRDARQVEVTVQPLDAGRSSPGSVKSVRRALFQRFEQKLQ